MEGIEACRISGTRIEGLGSEDSKAPERDSAASDRDGTFEKTDGISAAESTTTPAAAAAFTPCLGVSQ